MTKQKNYKKTLIACYLGFVTQAISANFAPLLFLTFKGTYGITLEKIAMIPMVFYLTQLLVDLAATKFADKIGYRTCVIASQVLSSIGLILMAILPELLPAPFIGILISVVLYAIGSGLIEVLVSPIVEACPFENKDGVMSLLHSFYCWGAMGVILGSTVFFAVFGVENWKILTFVWALVPLYNTFNFMNCPIERLVEDGESMGIGKLLKTPIFWLMIILMVCSGASEATMAQWASAFTESAIGVSKAIGDLVGPCLFAMFMGISRMLYGKFSQKLDLTKVMLVCSAMCVGCYLLASLSVLPILGLAGCALCGLAVGIMWPGSISISSKHCPRGGTAMFAFLALAGDLGATVSPAMVGSLSEMAGGNLKTGLFVATLFPVILVIGLIILRSLKKQRLLYAGLFFVLLLTEIVIALFVDDRFVRPYVGDMLVTLLLCCFCRIFIPRKLRFLPVYVFLFAAAVELGQHFDMVKLLGFENNRFLSVLVGRTFSFADILCYAAGCLMFFGIDYVVFRKSREP